MPLNIEDKLKIICKFGSNVKDSGSTSVQIALLSARINYLQHHFLLHKKDYHSRRGLLRMVSRRRKLLNYLKNKNISSYMGLIDHLGIRR
ncbi:30S ribosomal protein S15 [Blochmannia endosymbiont of Camponotus (Colobopsis) obliquus]|uniref:30S ribosomal protein S15 n=1 Tax=Blochmannia endosymbiont of Camponotus (Colobopsis) obliquus TaxID=1505597 RepID=UPI00061A866C|nr:30S ribosomal protein S15 [Blochmannia endosymbiont of Camponotus (Colobopsis) obliquus]AKC60284.1 30S ribosomal protein S15 [Blochmannia endosymbiont of Camponotus (Colobopsis) obliquus]